MTYFFVDSFAEKLLMLAVGICKTAILTDDLEN